MVIKKKRRKFSLRLEKIKFQQSMFYKNLNFYISRNMNLLQNILGLI